MIDTIIINSYNFFEFQFWNEKLSIFWSVKLDWSLYSRAMDISTGLFYKNDFIIVEKAITKRGYFCTNDFHDFFGFILLFSRRKLRVMLYMGHFQSRGTKFWNPRYNERFFTISIVWILMFRICTKIRTNEHTYQFMYICTFILIVPHSSKYLAKTGKNELC